MKFFKVPNGGGATLLAKNNRGFDSIEVLNYNSSMKNYSYRKHFSVILNLIQDLSMQRFRNKFGMTKFLYFFKPPVVMQNSIKHLKNKRLRNEFGMTDSLYPTDESCHPELVSGSEFKSYKKFKKLAAFTLAEVLITLAIIGVVAAMTIPTLVSNIQERQFHAKWKECYAILNNAFKLAAAENPRLSILNGSSNSFPSNEFIDAFFKHLYVEDTCGVSTVYDPKRCDASYKNPPWVGIYNIWSYYKTLAGGNLNAYDFCYKAALLRNGAVIYFGGLWSGPTIVVDVNGYNQGPNVVGRDVYAINIGTSQTKYIEETSFRPFGAEGTQTEKSGYQGCSPDIGASSDANGNINALYGAPGVGCSYKYLNEK